MVVGFTLRFLTSSLQRNEEVKKRKCEQELFIPNKSNCSATTPRSVRVICSSILLSLQGPDNTLSYFGNPFYLSNLK